jgi:GST-like protein
MTDPTPYTPPAVWTWNKANGGQLRQHQPPHGRPTHDKELPVGRTRCSCIRWPRPTA